MKQKIVHKIHFHFFKAQNSYLEYVTKTIFFLYFEDKMLQILLQNFKMSVKKFYKNFSPHLISFCWSHSGSRNIVLFFTNFYYFKQIYLMKKLREKKNESDFFKPWHIVFKGSHFFELFLWKMTFFLFFIVFLSNISVFCKKE